MEDLSAVKKQGRLIIHIHSLCLRALLTVLVSFLCVSAFTLLSPESLSNWGKSTAIEMYKIKKWKNSYKLCFACTCICVKINT